MHVHPPRVTGPAVRYGSRRWSAAAVCLVALAGCGPSEPSVGSVERPAGSPATVGDGPSERRSPAVGGAAVSTRASLPASDVLRAWDRSRAGAFASGDVPALRRLYVEGSAAGVADVALLRAYLRRGVRVEGMGMQLLAVDVLSSGPRRLRLRVTDRVTGAVAVGNGLRTQLPADRASTRVVVLRREPGRARWRMVSVSGVSR